VTTSDYSADSEFRDQAPPRRRESAVAAALAASESLVFLHEISFIYMTENYFFMFSSHIHADRQTNSFIENSIEAGILLGGNGSY
jgi:hypothetical protein